MVSIGAGYWLSGNGEAGFGAYDENASCTVTGNRIEWNHGGGIVIRGGNHYNFANTYIDRSGGPGLCLLARGDQPCRQITVTGSCIYRSGKPEWTGAEHLPSAQVWLDGVEGLTFIGNSLSVGRDDGGRGGLSPELGIRYGRLATSVIQGNTLLNGALRELLVDEGGHGPDVIVRDNPGSLHPGT